MMAVKENSETAMILSISRSVKIIRSLIYLRRNFKISSFRIFFLHKKNIWKILLDGKRHFSTIGKSNKEHFSKEISISSRKYHFPKKKNSLRKMSNPTMLFQNLFPPKHSLINSSMNSRETKRKSAIVWQSFWLTFHFLFKPHKLVDFVARFTVLQAFGFLWIFIEMFLF